MTPELSTAFRTGFLTRLAQAGVGAEDLEQTLDDLLTKSAELPGPLEAIGPAVRSGAGFVAGAVPNALTLAALGLAIPPALSYGAGYAVGQAGNGAEGDVDELQRQELRDTYRQMTERLQHAQKAREFEQQRASKTRQYL